MKDKLLNCNLIPRTEILALLYMFSWCNFIFITPHFATNFHITKCSSYVVMT